MQCMAADAGASGLRDPEKTASAASKHGRQLRMQPHMHTEHPDNLTPRADKHRPELLPKGHCAASAEHS
jgi:hypothetical protein